MNFISRRYRYDHTSGKGVRVDLPGFEVDDGGCGCCSSSDEYETKEELLSLRDLLKQDLEEVEKEIAKHE